MKSLGHVAEAAESLYQSEGNLNHYKMLLMDVYAADKQ
jgi:hypothetical protein